MKTKMQVTIMKNKEYAYIIVIQQYRELTMFVCVHFLNKRIFTLDNIDIRDWEVIGGDVK